MKTTDKLLIALTATTVLVFTDIPERIMGLKDDVQEVPYVKSAPARSSGVQDVFIDPQNALTQDSKDLFKDNGYRAQDDVQETLNKMYELEGSFHRKMDASTTARSGGKRVRVPGLLDELDDALGSQRSHFSKKLGDNLTDEAMERARDYLAIVTDEQERKLGVSTEYMAKMTLETGGQVPTGSAVNPLTPPQNGSYHDLSNVPKNTTEMRAKVEYNLRNYVTPNGQKFQGNNNFFVSMAKRESGLNPWSGKPPGDKGGHSLMFQMGNAERAAHGGSRPGDWAGQRQAAESLAVSNMTVVLEKVSYIDKKKISFSSGAVFDPDDSAISAASWHAGPSAVSGVLNGKRQFSGDQLGTNSMEYMIEFAGDNVNFRDQAEKILERSSRREAAPQVKKGTDHASLTIPSLDKDEGMRVPTVKGVSLQEKDFAVVTNDKGGLELVNLTQEKLEQAESEHSSWVGRLRDSENLNIEKPTSRRV